MKTVTGDREASAASDGKLCHVRRLYAVRTAIAAAIALVTFGTARLCAAFPHTATAAARPLSRFFMSVIGAITALVPFSIAEFSLYALIVAVPALLIISIIRAVRSQSALPLARLGANCALTAACTFAFFILAWGLCYNTLSIADDLGLEIRSYTQEELAALGKHLAGELNAHADLIPRNGEGVPQIGGFYDIRRAIGDNRAKPVAASRLMSYTGIAGIFMPLTAEANVNADMPSISIPFTMAHELAHANGYAREDEANFAAYLTCRESDSAAVRYSGYMSAYTYVTNALFTAEMASGNGWPLYGEIFDSLSETVQNDLAYRYEYWSQFEGKVAEVASNINDTYIKTMDTSEPTAAVETLAAAGFYESGARRYGAVVDLLLADYYR